MSFYKRLKPLRFHTGRLKKSYGIACVTEGRLARTCELLINRGTDATHPPAKRCSSVSFCAIFAGFRRPPCPCLLASVWNRIDGEGSGAPVVWSPCAAVLRASAGSVQLSAGGPSCAVTPRRSGSHLRQWAGRGRCPWRRDMCSTPFFQVVAQLSPAIKIPKTTGQQHWVPPDLHRFQCSAYIYIYNNILIIAFIHDGSFIIHAVHVVIK